MKSILLDLYRHQAWADAEHWAVINAQPPLLADQKLLQRLLHIHQAQVGFLLVACGTSFGRDEIPASAEPSTLRLSMEAYHQKALSFLQNLPEEKLSAIAAIPWLQEPKSPLTQGQALLQAVFHSHYHRAQNATRMRELGTTPPLTDLILWYAHGQPSPRWNG